MKTNSLKLLSAAGLAALLATTAACGSDDSAEAGSKICVNEYVSLPILKDALEGMKESLDAAGKGADDGVEIDIRNPEGDAATQQTIASQFLRDKNCSVLVGLTTPGSQVFLQPGRKAPLVFFASSAPIEAKLAKTLENPGNNTTGVSDPLPVELELQAMLKIDPSIKTVGLIWKNGDASGDALAARAKKAAADAGIEVIESPIANPSETTQASRLLVDKVDAIQVAGDGPTVSGVAGILKVAKDADIPVFGGTTESVDQGAVVAGVYDYGQLGGALGKLVTQVLDGEDAGTIPVFVPDETAMAVNKEALSVLGLSVPAGLEVVESGSDS